MGSSGDDGGGGTGWSGDDGGGGGGGMVASSIVKGRLVVAGPPSGTGGFGFSIVTVATPGLAIRAAGTDTISSVALDTTAGSSAPFHMTRVAGFWRKLAPCTTRLKAEPPAVARFGTSSVSTGTAPRWKAPASQPVVGRATPR